MFETILINDGKLGKIHHCSTFEDAVNQAIKSLVEVVGVFHPVDERNVRSDLEAVMEHTFDDVTVYIGQAEKD